MNEQAVRQQYQQMIAQGMSPAQAAQQLARLAPQYAQLVQQLAGGQPGMPPQGAVTPQAAPASAPQQQVAAARAAGPAGPTAPGPPQAGAPVPQRPPGYYQTAPAGPADKYGGGMRANTNAAGVQSNGDDDPWSIGAGRGTTYDPEVMSRWYERAKAGDGKAAYVLRQVGFLDEQNRPVFNTGHGMEDWANSRSLDRRAAAGSPAVWYHDPKNWGGQQGFTGAADADTAFKADPWSQLHADNERPSSYPASRGQQPVGQGGEPLPGGADRSPAELTAAFNDRGTGQAEVVKSNAPAYRSSEPAPDEPEGPGPETDVDQNPAANARKDPKLGDLEEALRRRWYGKF